MDEIPVAIPVKVGTGKTGRSWLYANPFVKLNPMRKPVKEPGPIETAIPSNSSQLYPDNCLTFYTILGNSSAEVRGQFSSTSEIQSPSDIKAAPQINVAVSIARIFKC